MPNASATRGGRSSSVERSWRRSIMRACRRCSRFPSSSVGSTPGSRDPTIGRLLTGHGPSTRAVGEGHAFGHKSPTARSEAAVKEARQGTAKRRVASLWPRQQTAQKGWPKAIDPPCARCKHRRRFTAQPGHHWLSLESQPALQAETIGLASRRAEPRRPAPSHSMPLARATGCVTPTACPATNRCANWPCSGARRGAEVGPIRGRSRGTSRPRT